MGTPKLRPGDGPRTNSHHARDRRARVGIACAARMPLTQLTLRQHNRSQHVSAQGFSSHPVVEPPPPPSSPYCPPGKIPYGVLFTFGSADVGYNNLGGYPGGPDVKCTVGPHSDSDSSTCGNSAAERPCGCGCDCRETAAYTEGPYGFGAPSPEIRFQGGGLFFDGTIEGMQGTPFDVALTNSSSYKPWASDSNGRGRDPTAWTRPSPFVLSSLPLTSPP